jgi:hypothetical protein
VSVGVGVVVSVGDVLVGGGVVGVTVLVGGAVVVAGGVFVAGAVVCVAVELLADGLTDVVAVDEDTVLTLVPVAGTVADVPPIDAVAGLTAWLTDPEGPPPVLPLSVGGLPPEFSSKAITAAATPQTATPAPPAMIRRRVNGEASSRSPVEGSCA